MNGRHLAFLFTVSVWLAYRCVTLSMMDGYPDPRDSLIAQDALRVIDGKSPTLFHWPGTPWTYLLASLSAVCRVETIEGVARIGRFATLPFGVMSLVLLYVIGRQVTPRTAWVAPLTMAGSLAFSSGEANMALVDLPAMAFALLGVTLASFVVNLSQRSWRFAGFAGLSVGIGMAFKLTAFVVIVPITLLIVGSRLSEWRSRIPMIGLVVATVIIGFVVGCPFVLADLMCGGDYGVFNGLQYELRHYHLGHFGLFATAHDRWFSPLHRHGIAFIWATGFLLGGALSAGAIMSVRRARSPFVFALVGWLVVSVAAILTHRFSFTRHWLVVLPPLCLLGAVGVEALVIRWKRVGAFAVGIVVLHAAVSVFVFDAPMRTPPTVVEANARFRSRQPHSLSYGPVEPIFTWLYPSWVLENGGATSLARSRIVIVVKPEAEVQRAIYNRPTDYRDDDFFPLTRYDFIGGKFYADLETSTVFQLIETYRREPHPLARTLLFAGLSPPFPLNALLHPEIRVYERIDPLREK